MRGAVVFAQTVEDDGARGHVDALRTEEGKEENETETEKQKQIGLLEERKEGNRKGK